LAFSYHSPFFSVDAGFTGPVRTMKVLEAFSRQEGSGREKRSGLEADSFSSG
jgi:hypothetical protein